MFLETESSGDSAHDWSTSRNLSSEKELNIWSTDSVLHLSERLEPSGASSPSAASTSARNEACPAPRESLLHWTPGPQLQQRVQLVKLLSLLFICTHSHCAWFMRSVSLWPILCVKSQLLFDPTLILITASVSVCSFCDLSWVNANLWFRVQDEEYKPALV